MMLNFSRNLEKVLLKNAEYKQIMAYSLVADEKKQPTEKFKALNLKTSRSNFQPRKQRAQDPVPPPRSKQMATDQDWGNVWPGPRSFHPATVPLPIRQGYVEKGAPPDKHANAELMKIPNFLHLTPPVIKRQCEALKKFCTEFPESLKNDDKCWQHFPIEVTSSDYCHSSPTIRDPMARIVTVRFKLEALKFDERAKDKFLRLVGNRYNEESDIVTIVTDRCPLKRQNYDYAMYLVTALYHEALNVEPWENLKSLADMEYYDWNKNASKTSLETLFNKKYEEIEHSKSYVKAVTDLMNEGESEYTVEKYAESVRNLLNVPKKI